MEFRIHHVLRFTLMILSGFLIVGATATWHSMGYLSPFAWLVEWLDILFAFLCIFIAIRSTDIRSKTPVYALIILSAALVLLPINSVSKLTVFVTPSPVNYLVFLIPILFFILLLLFSSKPLKHAGLPSLIFFLFVLSSLMYVTYLFYSYSMRFPTDESVVDLYSAHLFLNGLNPYIHSNIIGGFGYYNYPIYANTPLTTGGYVYYLTYPALSFISVIPAEILGFKESLLMYPFFAVPVLLAWFRGWSRKEWLNSVMVMLPFLSLSIYTSQIEFADLNIVWASLMMLSYYVLPRSGTSGFLYGLSLSVKQFPAITFTFFIYYIYREYGMRQAAFWFVTAVIAFLAVNGYFMVISPRAFFSSILANETSPLIGVGFGLSQLSFLGIFPIPSVYFSISMVALTLASITIYVAYYRELKYALFAFPIIIFLLNYRLFVQYIMYWLLLSLLPFLDLLHAKELGTRVHEVSDEYALRKNGSQYGRHGKVVSAILIVVVVGSVIGGFDQGIVHNPGTFQINSVVIDEYNSSGYIDVMSVNLSFHGNAISHSNVLFRIITPEPIGNLNMYLWRPALNVTLYSGEVTTLKIIPVYSIDPIPQNTTYRMVAYFGDAMGSYSGRT